MKITCLALLATLPFALSHEYQVPELDYNNDEATCDNVNALIAATTSDLSRITNYVDVTLPKRSSKLNDIYASVKKTCSIIQSKRPSFLQTSKLRAENVETLHKLSNKVKQIADSLEFGHETSKKSRSLVHLNMNSVVPQDLCDDVLNSIEELKEYIRFLIPGITEKYIEGILSDRLSELQDLQSECADANCDEKDAEKKRQEEEEAKKAAEEAEKKRLEEEEAEKKRQEEEAEKKRQEEEEAKKAAEEAEKKRLEAEEAEKKRLQEEEEAKKAAEEAEKKRLEAEEAEKKRLQEEKEAEEAAAAKKAKEEEEARKAAEEAEKKRLEAEEAEKKRLQEEEEAKKAAEEAEKKRLEEEAAKKAAEEAAKKKAEEEAAKKAAEEEAAKKKALEDPKKATEEAEKKRVETAEAAVNGSDALYTFYPTLDSHGGDITLLSGYTVQQLKDWCTANKDCLGFNNNGWVKSSIKSKDEWNQWTNDIKVGFYLKKAAKVDAYTYYYNIDSSKNDIVHNTGYSIAQLKVACSADPNCLAFNTDGWLKKVVKSTSNWNKESYYASFGIYVKDKPEDKDYEYTFNANLDSAGNDIYQLSGQSVEMLKDLCDNNPECVGFTTDGNIKKALKPQAQWTSKTTPVNFGLYVKGNAKTYKTVVDNYAWYPKYETSGNDITQLKGYSVQALKDYCDANPQCLGFNTDGFIKSAIKPVNQWTRTYSSNNFGFYVKNGISAKPAEYTFYSFLDSSDTANDIIQLAGYSTEQLFNICNATPECKGFNTDGYLKKAIKPSNQFVRRTTTETFGLYVKK